MREVLRRSRPLTLVSSIITAHDEIKRLESDRAHRDARRTFVVEGVRNVVQAIENDFPPPAIRGRRSVSAALDRLDDYALIDKEAEAQPIGSSSAGDDLGEFLRRSLLDAYATADHLEAVAGARGDAPDPESELALRLKLTARLSKAGLGSRVYDLEQEGYDTHGHQLPRHAPLLEELSAPLRAFLDDLEASRLAVDGPVGISGRVPEHCHHGGDLSDR